jgi:putative peptidoglycan lipid II flippase
MKFGFLKIESFRKGMILSSAFNFIAKLLLFFQSVVIAYYFGTQTKTDVFFYCYTTIALAAVFINNLDSSVLIPESMRLREQEGTESSISFLNFFIYGYFLFGAVLTIVLYAFPVDIFLLISNFDINKLQDNKNILLFSIPLFTLIIMVNLLVNILTSYRFFTMPMIIGVINSVMVILFLFVFHEVLDIWSALIGQIIAYCVSLVFLFYLVKKNLNWNFTFKKVPLRKKVFNNILFAQAGNITSVLSSYIPMYLLSSFNPGVITALTYGQKTAEVPNQLITMQSSSVLGIKFNELYAKKDYDALNAIFLHSSQFLLFILVPISALIFLYAEPIIVVLFQRGAFDDKSVALCSEFFKYFALILPMLAINTLIARLFMASQQILQSFGYQVLFNIFLIVAVSIGIKLIGVKGYLFALLCLHIFNVAFCYILLKVFFPKIAYYKTLGYFALNVAVNAVIFSLVYLINKASLVDNAFISMLIGGFIYMVLLLTVNKLANLSTEANQLLNRIAGYLRFNAN